MRSIQGVSAETELKLTSGELERGILAVSMGGGLGFVEPVTGAGLGVDPSAEVGMGSLLVNTARLATFAFSAIEDKGV